MSEQFAESNAPNNGLRVDPDELKKPRPPYQAIAEMLREGDVVPFLGSGVNLIQRPHAEAQFNPDAQQFLPNGQELSNFLAKGCSFPSDDINDLTDLAKVASYYQELNGRPALFKDLRRIFIQHLDPTDIHNYLAGVARTRPLLIVTTNYDVLTEEAFKKAGVPYNLIIHPTERKEKSGSVLWWRPGETEPSSCIPNKLRVDLDSESVIYKMHGTVDPQLYKRDSYVITEDDYVDFLSLMAKGGAVPKQFLQYFGERQFLFLGYALRDWNLRVMLRSLTSAEGSNRRSWAIQFNPSKLERKLWRARNVTIFDVEMKEFVRELMAVV
jgi:hypothetical protein